jgi:hypothetical protein
MELRPQIHVVATTEEGTRGALVEARDLASRLNSARVVLLVPHFGSSYEPPADADATALIGERYRQLASDAGLTATVRVCMCRRYAEMFQWMLGKDAVIVVGGRRRWWWPTPEQQMTQHLKRAGQNVIFANVELR